MSNVEKSRQSPNLLKTPNSDIKPQPKKNEQSEHRAAPVREQVVARPIEMPLQAPVVRGQSPTNYGSGTSGSGRYGSGGPYSNPIANPNDRYEPQRMPVSGAPLTSPVQTAQAIQAAPPNPSPYTNGVFQDSQPPIYAAPPEPNDAPYDPNGQLPPLGPQFDPNFQLPGPTLPIDVMGNETRTGRFMFGVGVNSELGVSGQIVVDERNFDWTRVPTSWSDVVNGTAWRGAGQGFRLEAMPGSQFQRYSVSFTEPYLYLFGLNNPMSLSLSGFYYNRRFFDWDEQRVGGRVALGYRLTHDLSITTALRAEDVDIYNPRFIGEPELDRVVGGTELYTGRVTLTHDTRDQPFFPTEGSYLELSAEQGFGTFDFPRGELNFRQYFLVKERPDGSGRHTLGYTFKYGVTGSQTPIFENYFAGGFSTLRGFDFRGASPLGAGGVVTGGHMQFLGSVEYFFPLTADDMMKGVVFCDFGTVEREVALHGEDYRVAPGVGLRIAIPALGPAPLAFDLAFPVAHSDTDDIQNFSFFIGINR